ncbi:MAG TPA: TIGR00730 family Rossman fold protein, partial [Candidatus Micrarchaeota archaeon]|nr:TIGR00730 family Rossman fold protein [Candidatus Micrarchaeota archaeon]
TFNPLRHDAAQIAAWFEEDLKICHYHMGGIRNKSTSIFGSARAKAGEHYKSAKDLARRLSMLGHAVYSGGGKGIMEAVAKGVLAAGKKSTWPRPFLFMASENPDANKSDHVKLNMIASRKLVLGSSDALVFYPGGYGTLDELFEYAVRIQIGDMEPVPIVTMHRQFWKPLYKWIEKYPLEMGLIDQKDTGIISMADTPKETIRMISLHEGKK